MGIFFYVIKKKTSKKCIRKVFIGFEQSTHNLEYAVNNILKSSLLFKKKIALVNAKKDPKKLLYYSD